MEKEIRIIKTYKDDDISVRIEKRPSETSVTIIRDSLTEGTGIISLSKREALQLVTILHIANEEGDI